MKFNLYNTQESNPNNTKTHDLIVGMADLMQDFLLNSRRQKTYYEPVAEYSFEKIGRHISFTVVDLQTEDRITGFAMLAKN